MDDPPRTEATERVTYYSVVSKGGGGADVRAMSVSPMRAQLSPTFSASEGSGGEEEERVYLKQGAMKKKRLGIALSKQSLESPLSIRMNAVNLHKNLQLKKRWHALEGRTGARSPHILVERHNELKRVYGVE